MNWFQEQMIQQPSSKMKSPVDISLFYSETNLDIPRPVRNREVDGVIIQGMEPDPQSWSTLSRMPSVWFMTRRSADYPGDFVEPDNEQNGEIAANYLQANGDAQVAVINTDPNHSAIVSRTEAFVTRCRQHLMKATVINGAAKDAPAFLDAHPREDLVNQLVRRWVDMDPRPTGIYLPADNFCGSFLRAARHHRLRPERDFDLILGNRSPMIYPNLSHQPAAIDINLPTLVKRVVDHLVWRIDNFNSPGRVGITVSPTLFTAPTVSQREPAPQMNGSGNTQPIT